MGHALFRGWRGIAAATGAATAAAAAIGLALPALVAAGQAPAAAGQRPAAVAKATAAAVQAAAAASQPPAAASQPPAASGQAPAATGRVLAAGQTGSRADVPWRNVGPGWSLVLYSATQGGEGIKPVAGPATLYLVDPQGGRYRLFIWSAHSAQASWHLQAWSGDIGRALFVPENSPYGGQPQRVFQVQLRTGATTSFLLPPAVWVIGYTRPDGLNILAERSGNFAPTARETLMRFSLTGKLLKTLASVGRMDATAYQPGGRTLAAGSAGGLELISNAGGVIRMLPVRGASNGCSAVRWWSAGTILASCMVANQPGPRMWLVPAGGARPTPLTPARTGGFDLGDFDAWQLSSGLYVNGYGPCGTLVIGRQPAYGAEQMVNVPGSASSLIVNATRSRLQIERINDCSPGVSLVWFNPATRSITVAIGVRHNQHGVVGVVPYFVAGKF